ncbi:MAG TPA: hypothetical protein VM285_08035 [Polyangia bacterium]|nr:hypothetical protein [Polyangia bacterium]
MIGFFESKPERSTLLSRPIDARTRTSNAAEISSGRPTKPGMNRGTTIDWNQAK